MKANEKCISFETAKLLKDCGVESKYSFVNDVDDSNTEFWRSAHNVMSTKERYSTDNVYPAYTWQEILWENAECFFIDKYIRKSVTFETEKILRLLQQKKYEEADKYFRENCILIK